jgi:putative acetyltransferase
VTRPASETALFRDMVSADLPEMTDLWIASWQAAMPHIDFEARRVWFVDRMIAHREAGARTIVALHSGDIVGFVVIDPATGYLDQIAVAPSRQGQGKDKGQGKGQGFAAMLLAQAKKIAPGRIDLDVNQTNARAIRFYQREGFEIAGEAVNPNSGAPIYRMRWQPA